jgi:hypothetical protein
LIPMVSTDELSVFSRCQATALHSRGPPHTSCKFQLDYEKVHFDSPEGRCPTIGWTPSFGWKKRALVAPEFRAEPATWSIQIAFRPDQATVTGTRFPT